MDISAYYRIGLISKPHGLKGEVTILLDPDLPNDFSALETVFVLVAEDLVPYFISSSSIKGNKAYVKFEGVDTLAKAEYVSKCLLYLPKTARPKTGNGEFYSDEIIGFEAEDEEEGLLGPVSEVIQSGLQRLLSVNHNGKAVLIPVDGPFIRSINRTKKKIIVRLPQGFLEL